MSGTLTVGFIVNQGMPVPLAIILGILIGVLTGFVSGFIVSRFRVPAFIITMAMMNVANGVAYVYSGGQSTRNGVQFIAASYRGLSRIHSRTQHQPRKGRHYMVILIIVISFVLNKTKFGTYVYAIGGNRESARLSGVPIKKVLSFSLNYRAYLFVHLKVPRRQ